VSVGFEDRAAQLAAFGLTWIYDLEAFVAMKPLLNASWVRFRQDKAHAPNSLHTAQALPLERHHRANPAAAIRKYIEKTAG
jgi:hypothetical protein